MITFVYIHFGPGRAVRGMAEGCTLGLGHVRRAGGSYIDLTDQIFRQCGEWGKRSAPRNSCGRVGRQRPPRTGGLARLSVRVQRRKKARSPGTARVQRKRRTRRARRPKGRKRNTAATRKRQQPKRRRPWGPRAPGAARAGTGSEGGGSTPLAKGTRTSEATTAEAPGAPSSSDGEEVTGAPKATGA
jgi:hypothetical protein